MDYNEALKNPKSVFPSPAAVLEENSLSKDQKREILKSWETDAIRLQASEDEGFSGGERSELDKVEKALESLANDQG